jgi:hypothetical protein
MTFEELEESLIVQARLMDRLERHGLEQQERLDALMVIVESHEKRLGKSEEQMAAMQAAMVSLFEHLDRFVKGLSDGQKGE